jgi:hypothetical protein
VLIAGVGAVLIILIVRGVIKLGFKAKSLHLTHVVAPILEIDHHIHFGGPIVCEATKERLALSNLHIMFQPCSHITSEEELIGR